MRGTEVAQAYIDVGADMQRFRRDLSTRGRRLAGQLGDRMGRELSENMREQLAKGDVFGDMYDESIGKDLERDFQRIVNSSKSGDFKTFWKQFNDDGKLARRRIKDVSKQMQDLGRMTKDERKHVKNLVNEYDEMVKAQRKVNSSFEEMERVTKLKELNRDMQRLSRTTNEGRFRQIWREFGGDADKARDRVNEVTAALGRAGRMSTDSRVRISRMFEEFERGNQPVGQVNTRMRRLQRNFGRLGAIAKAPFAMIASGWKNMDNTVRLVISLISMAAGQAAAILSALGSTAVGAASSIGMALGALIPLAGTAVAAALGISMMVSAMERMREQFPSINKGIDGIKSAWDGWLDSFSAEAGEAIGGTLNAIAAQMERFDLGGPMGKAMAGVSDAFTRTLNSPGFTAFMRALRDRYPSAVENFGSGFARVFEAISSLFAGVAPAADRLGRMFDRWAAGLARTAEEARKSGAMKEVFNAVADSVSAVWDVISSLGAAIGAVFMATSGHGDNLLHSFAGLIDRFTKWVKTAEGQERINEWFKTAEFLLPVIGELLGSAGRAMAKLVTPETIELAGNLLETISDFLPKLANMLETASRADVLGTIAHLLDSISGAIQPLLPHMSRMATLFSGALKQSIDAFRPVLDAIVAAIEPIMQRFGDAAVRVIPKLVDAFRKISSALQPVIDVIGMVANVVSSIMIPIFESLIMGAIEGVVNAFQGFGSMVEGVVTLVKGIFSGDFAQMWEGLKGIVLGAVQAVWGLIQLYFVGKILGIVRSFVGSVPKLISSMWNGIRSFFSGGVTKIANLVQNWSVNIYMFFANLMARVHSVIGTVWTGIQSLWTAVITTIRTWTVAAFTMIRSGISTALNAVRTVVSNIWTGIQSLWTAAVTTVQTWTTAAFTMIRTGISTALNAVRTVVSTIWTGIQALWTGALTMVQTVTTTVFTAIRTGISMYLNAVRTVISTVWTGIQALWTTAVTMVRTVTTTAFNAIKTGISTALNAVRTVVTTIWNAVSSFITTAVTNIRTGVVNGFKAVHAGISAALAAALAIVTSLWNKIKKFITDSVSAIRTAVVNAFNKVRDGIRTALQKARSIVSNIFNTIRNTISNVVNAIRSRVSSAFNAVRNGISTALNAARNVVSNVFNTIRNIAVNVANSVRSGVTTAFNNVRSGVMNAVNGIRSSVTSGFNNVMNTVRNLPNRIWSALSKLWDDGISLGKNLIKGLINGIGSMAGTLWKAAQNIAKSAVNAIKGFFGIKSPSTVMRGFGHNIGEGLKLGLGDEEKEVANGMKHLADEALGGVSFDAYTDAGVKAAEAFANGLSKVDMPNLGALASAGSQRLTSGTPMRGPAYGALQSSTSDSRTIIEEGAIQVQTPAQDGRIVAGQMLDELVKEI